MKNVVIFVALMFGVLLYMTWMNGVFRRCPYCRKIGSWRYDDAEPAVEEKGADGWVESRS